MAFGQVPENPELARPVCRRQTSLQRPDLLRHGVPESQRLGGTAGNECGCLDRPSSPQELNTGSHWNLIKKVCDCPAFKNYTNNNITQHLETRKEK